jgi:SPP1 family predicted phage head-tail adaptor
MSGPGIGALRDRVTLESPSRTADGGGGAAVTWTTVAEVWAAVRPITGAERLEADQIAGRITHEVWLRERPDVVPAMRLRQDARVLHIVAVLRTGRRNRLKCLCEERQL